MYGNVLEKLLGPSGGVGTPPPTADPFANPPGPPNAGQPAPPPPIPDMILRAQHESKAHAFLQEAAKEFVAGNIGADDLKKAVSASGNAPDYHTWKHENVQHLKAAAKAKE